MRKPMRMALFTKGVHILYKCYKLPGYGKRCPDKNTDKCFKCKFCKVDMNAADATKLLSYYKTGNENLKKS